MNPFEYANDLMVKEGYDEDIEQRKDYKEFLINRSISYQPDLIHIINEINRYPDVDKKLHYDFLHNIIPLIHEYLLQQNQEFLKLPATSQVHFLYALRQQE